MNIKSNMSELLPHAITRMAQLIKNRMQPIAMTRSEIQSESDAKRGVVAKTYKLPKELVAQIATML